jgi:hypothetical protein
VTESGPEELFFPQLQAIGRIDCSTPKCYANGVCTGYLRLSESVGWWGIEYECPDCNSKGLSCSGAVNRLVQELLALDEAGQGELMRRYVATRPNSRKPFSEPWD